MLRLSGWQRLWIFVTVIYLVIVGAISYATFPSGKNVRGVDQILKSLKPDVRKLVALDSEDKDNAVSPAGQKIQFPDGRILTIQGGLSEQENEAVGRALVQATRQEIKRERKSFLRSALLAAILPCAAIYALGWGIGWVRRGFSATHRATV